MCSSPGVSHQVATPRPQLFPVHRTSAALRSRSGRAKEFLVQAVVPSQPPGCPQPSRRRQQLRPTCPQRRPQAGERSRWRSRTRMRSCSATRDPRLRQRLTLCKGKAEREPADHRGSREPWPGQTLHRRRRQRRECGHGQQTGSNLCRLVCLPGCSCAWQPVAEAHTATASISRSGAAGRRAERQDAGTPGDPAGGIAGGPGRTTGPPARSLLTS